MSKEFPPPIPSAKAFDFFCGIGGLTYGLRSAGIHVTAGLDNDESCRFGYETNCKAEFINSDIKDVSYSDISPYLDGSAYKIMVGCAPCQPFSPHTSKVKQKSKDSRLNLLAEFLGLIEDGRPDIVSMENVPTIRKRSVFHDFKQGLERLGYSISVSIVRSEAYGVPQRRHRLVLLASRLGNIELHSGDHSANPKTVKEAIGHLEQLSHGEASSADPMHSCSALAQINLERIRASVPGGSWRDWPNSLLPECYKRSTGESYGCVYGRMSWDLPAPTLTTQFLRYGTGRFGHPEQDRALSLREGALLQSFPEDYEFFRPGDKPSLTSIARQIGNAVPPLLGRGIGISIVNHLRNANGNA